MQVCIGSRNSSIMQRKSSDNGIIRRRWLLPFYVRLFGRRAVDVERLRTTRHDAAFIHVQDCKMLKSYVEARSSEVKMPEPQALSVATAAIASNTRTMKI